MNENSREPDDSKPRRIIKRILHSAIFGGIIGGFAFALISPAILPWMTGIQAQTGVLVDEPKVQVDIQGGPTTFVSKYNTTFPERGSTYNYTITIENTQNRLAEDVRLTFYFKGCAENRGFLARNGRVYAEPGVRFNTTHCAETVFLPDLPKGDKVRLRYEVNATSPSQYLVNLVTIGESHYMAYNVEYQWHLNGMVFYSEYTVRINQTDLYN